MTQLPWYAKSQPFPWCYKLENPGGETFYAIIAETAQGMMVYSSRGGQWQANNDMLADLLMPEQEMHDWDVTRVTRDELPKGLERFSIRT